MNRKIRVALLDDHSIFLSGLSMILEKSPKIDTVCEALTADELFGRLESASIDVLVTDLSMPETNGFDVIDKMRKQYPEVAVVVLTVHKEPVYYEKAMRKGVLGYILKDDAWEKLVMAIENAAAGKKTYSHNIVETAMDRIQMQQMRTQRLNLLSSRERQVLEYIANGLSNKEIAERLDLSVRTVESHRANLMEKLELESYNELIRFALNVRIID